MNGRSYQKSHRQGNYRVIMWKAQFGFAKTHKILTLEIPCSEGNYPVETRRRRVENAEAEALYQKAIAWINSRI